jgi:16S rRNA (cytosine1402-N4)-methyltransferase
MNNQILHNPVLTNEVIKLFNINPSGTYVDCTAGFGGHSELMLKKLNNDGRLVCIDQDNEAISFLKNKFANDKRVQIVKDNFINVLTVLNQLNINEVDGVLADLGVSSVMFDKSNRGFSYLQNDYLDMRMDQTQKLNAHFVLNHYDAKQLQIIFREYGEVMDSKNVINNIIQYRKNKPIDTTFDFVNLIKDSIHKSILFKKKHPATKYFQAVRIEVNNELNNLKTFLEKVVRVLKHKGILLIISFHSLEDRIVKQYFNKLTSSKIPKEVPIKNEIIDFQLLNKKPILPTEHEVDTNHRSRSAKLRGLRRN